MTGTIATHLWQSTLFAALAWLLALMLRKNRAAVRYWIWFAASLKFLIPFSWLSGIGGQLGQSMSTPIAPAAAPFIEQVSQPFSAPPSFVHISAPATSSFLPAVLFAVWACGFMALAFSWTLRWRRIRRALRSAQPLAWNATVPVFSTPALVEPGVFGIFRPVLLLPEGIAEHLQPAQLEAILAHEWCHVRRRDNLAAAIHMLVEAIFWFHPLVWWIGRRLVEERERACDEEVVRLGSEPQVYVESILKICKFYLEQPLKCVSGVTGSNLKRRIVRIMTQHATSKLSLGRKLLLVATGTIAAAWPVLFGLLSQARSQPTAPLSFEVASIKPNKSYSLRFAGIQLLPGGRFHAGNVPLQAIIATAYNVPVQSNRLSGGPDWIRSERYDIEATPETSAIPAEMPAKIRDEKIRSMLQTLLADRFKLVVRQETKEFPVYAVAVAKSGPKLQKAKVEEQDCAELATAIIPCHQFGGGQGQGIHAQAVSISDLVRFVENWTDRPVIDRTGIQGLFSIQTEGWVPLRARMPVPGREPTAEDLAFTEPTRPTLFMIFDRLGLKLESQKAPIETFVIEHVERPTEN